MFRSIFNENTDQFLYAKKFRFVLYRKNLDLYLMKIQICLCMKKNQIYI